MCALQVSLALHAAGTDLWLCFVSQEKAAQVLGAYQSSNLAGSSVLSFAELSALCSGVCADESTLCVALLQLQRDKQVTVSLHDGEKVTCASTLEATPDAQQT